MFFEKFEEPYIKNVVLFYERENRTTFFSWGNVFAPAEREENMRGTRKFINNLHIRMAALLLAMSIGAVLTGCGSSKASDSAATASTTNGSYYAEDAAAESIEYSEGFVAGTGAMEEDKTEASADVTVTDRKLIKTVDMDVETQEFDTLLSTIESRVKELGGYIENMNTYNGSSYYGYGGTRDADMTIRVPKDQLDAFLNTVTGISNVIRRSDNVEDVTLAYVDLESHRDALRTEQDRLLELLERAESIEDIITIEQRLSDVRYQLESMESQLRTYDNQVDYSTVYLYIEEVEIYTPAEEDTVWERISSGFAESLRNIGDGFVEFGMWFVVTIPYIIVWAVIIVILVFLFYGVIKCFNRAEAKRKNTKTQSTIAQNSQPGKTIENTQNENK